MQRFTIDTRRRCEMREITREVRDAVREIGVADGVATVYVPHTTAGVTIQENADPDVQHDILLKLDRLFPRDEPGFRHAEGNSDSHLKTMLVGTSAAVVVSGGDPVLGRWQGVYLCEFDGPRTREVVVEVVASAGKAR